jgi:putative ABC transport system substrate-binding protein
MRRRQFIALVGGAAAAWPLGTRAQEPGRIYRLGELHLSLRSDPWNIALFDAVKPDGFIEGQNLVVDDHGFGLHIDQLADHATAVVKAQVDLITCAGEPAVRAAQQATKSIPIFAVANDMVRSGFVASLAKPGGNTTGVSILATELDGKRQEMLLEVVPGVRRMAALADANDTLPQQLQALQDAARARGVELSIYRVAKAEEIAGAIDAAKASGATALNVLASAMLNNNRQIILPRVAALGLPAIYQFPVVAEEGGLIGYGSSLEQIYRDVGARQLVKLLRGVKPAEIPVEQPTGFELVVRSAFDGTQNARIGAAAADMPAHLRDDLSASRVRVPLQQIDRAHDLAGLTVAALRYPLGQPRPLHGMRGVRRKPLDGRDLLAGNIRGLRLARKRALAVDMHHAGAAEADAAAELGAGEFEFFPDHP